jgi:uncharacterized protein
MELELRRLRAAPGRQFSLRGQEVIPSLDWHNERVTLEGAVTAVGSVFYQEEQLYLTLEVRGKAHRICSRCLAELVEEFHHRDFWEIPLSGVGAYLDLRPWVESGVRLALDPRPLCRPDCRGLCPQCGADLNREGHRPGCQAVARKVDPRLAKLKELL